MVGCIFRFIGHILPVCRELRIFIVPICNIFRNIILSNYVSQAIDILQEASYRFGVSWDAFSDSSDIYFLFAEDLEICTTILTVLIGLQRGYH